MAEYKRIPVRRYPRLVARDTAEDRHWKKFKIPIAVKEISAVTSIDFSKTQPFDFACSTSTRVQIYSTATNKIKKTISRFKDIAYCPTFRHDGKLVVAGGEEGIVQIFDMNSRALLRKYQGHTRPVHVSRFSSNGLSIFSGSDDSTVCLWDVASDKLVSCLEGHEDYIRAGVASQAGSHLFLSGSYDHTVKLWDTRVGKSVFSVDHEAPVEAVLMFPGGGTFISAGGNKIKVWDALGRNYSMYTFSNHQKTITSLCFDADCKRLLSGSLDRQVKVYDVQDYSVVHSFKYSGPILSIGLSPNDTHLVAGMATGLLSIRHRKLIEGATVSVAKRNPRAGSFRFFVRGHDHKPDPRDFRVEVKKKKKLSAYDNLLKKFKFHEALDTVLLANHRAVVVMSFLHELIQRDGLRQSLSGRDEHGLKPILSFVVKHIANPRYASALIDIGNILIDMFAPGMGQSPVVDELFVKLQRKLRAELALQQNLFQLLVRLSFVSTKITVKYDTADMQLS